MLCSSSHICLILVCSYTSPSSELDSFELWGAKCLKISHLLQIYKSHTRYIYPTPDIIYPTPDIYTPLQIYIPHSRYNIPHSRYIYPTPDIYTPLQIYIPHSRYIYTPLQIYPTQDIIPHSIWSRYNISGVGYIYLEWGIYIWSGVYISGVGFIYCEQMTDFETYGTPY